MRLLNVFMLTAGLGLLSVPAMNSHFGSGPYFANEKGKQAEPSPKPERSKTEFAVIKEWKSGDSTYELAATEPAIAERDLRIVVNIPATSLTLFENGVSVLELPVAVGQAIYKTPVGRNEIKQIVWNPWWHPPDAEWAKDEKVTPPGPKNPLGPVKMIMSGDIRMHGTTKDSSIGSAASHGCIRMHSKDAVRLAWYLQRSLTDKSDASYLEKYKKMGKTSYYVQLSKGVPVDIVYQPVAFKDDMVILYPDLYGRAKDLKTSVAWEMYQSGVDPTAFDLSKFSKPPRKAVEVSINEILNEKIR